MQSEAVKLLRECPDFAFACLGRLCVTLAQQVVQVSIAYYIYDVTGDPFALAWLGLAGIIPSISLVLLTGYTADRFERRRILLCSDIVLTIAASLLLMLVTLHRGVIWPIYLIIIIISSARAFNNPAAQAIVPSVLPPERLATGVAFSSGTFQAGQIVGPALGGVLYLFGPSVSFSTAMALYMVAGLAAIMIKHNSRAVSGKAPVTIKTLLAGFKFSWDHQVVLGAVSLDTVCVMFGGVTMLLPIFAKDILEIGPFGNGILRASPAIGGILMAMWLSNNDFVKRNSGTKLFAGVGMYGLMIVMFGLSRNVYLSVLCLILSGAADMVSVVIRHTLVQSETPDELRGRVSSVNSMFISSSTELGHMRAGIFAGLFGAGMAAVIGGAAAIALSLLWPKLFPEIRSRDHLVEPVQAAERAAAKQAGA